MPMKRSHWNFRVVREDKQLSIREVYYRHDGTVSYWTTYPMAVTSETRRGLRWVLKRMAEGAGKPVLVRDGKTLVEEKKKGRRQ